MKKSMMTKDYKYDVAVVVAIYNQCLSKIILTVKSILVQKDISIKIVIADDCSKNNHFFDIENFLLLNGCNDYEILSSEENKGTVFNLLRSIDYCDSEFVKFISPGDALFDEYSLSQWVGWTREKKALVTFSDAIYYEKIDGGKYRCVKEHTYPQNVSVFYDCINTEKQMYYQVLCNDYWLGAATLINTFIAGKYLNKINGIVKYGEDNIYRLMAYDGVMRCYYPNNAILYECNTGISSLGSRGERWHKTLMEEWYQTSLIILNYMDKNNDANKEKFEALIKWKYDSAFRGSKLKDKKLKKLFRELIPLYLKFPRLLFWHVKTIVNERCSNMVDDTVVEEKILKYIDVN